MKKVILIIIILSTYLGLAGQKAIIDSNDGNSALGASIAINTLSSNNFRASDLKYKDVKGIPYLEKEKLIGYVVMMDDQKTEEVPLQYDIYSNEFFYIDKSGNELIIDLKLVKEIVMRGKEESYLFKRINPQKPHKFYEVLYESDDLDIYNEMGINFFEGKEQGIAKIDPRFSRDDSYYTYKKGTDPKKLKLKKKNVYKLFSKEEQQQIDTIIKDQKIKLKKSKDFKRLFTAMKE